VEQVQVHQLLEQQLHMLAAAALILISWFLPLLAEQVEVVTVVIPTLVLLNQEFLEPLIQVAVLVVVLVLLVFTHQVVQAL
jgi:hypothetical protein